MPYTIMTRWYIVYFIINSRNCRRSYITLVIGRYEYIIEIPKANLNLDFINSMEINIVFFIRRLVSNQSCFTAHGQRRDHIETISRSGLHKLFKNKT